MMKLVMLLISSTLLIGHFAFSQDVADDTKNASKEIVTQTADPNNKIGVGSSANANVIGVDCAVCRANTPADCKKDDPGNKGCNDELLAAATKGSSTVKGSDTTKNAE